MKRVSAVLTVCALLLSFLPVFGFSETVPAAEISLDSVSVLPGEQAKLTLKISSNPGIAGIVVSFEYDKSVLTLEKAENGSLFSGFTTGLNYIWDSSSNITAAGIMGTFTFSAASSAANGKYPVNIIVRGCTDEEYNNVSCTVKAGMVTVCDHSDLEEVKGTAPTCLVAGLSAGFRCRDCGSWTVPQTTLKALGHNYVKTVKAPTCTEKGYTTYQCSRCTSSYKSDEKAALGHNYVKTVKAPTCTEKGYATYQCSRCTSSYKSDEKAALGHQWNNGEITVAPTASAGGIKTFTCGQCGAKRTEKLPAVGSGNSLKTESSVSGNVLYLAVDIENAPEIGGADITGITFDGKKLRLKEIRSGKDAELLKNDPQGGFIFSVADDLSRCAFSLRNGIPASAKYDQKHFEALVFVFDILNGDASGTRISIEGEYIDENGEDIPFRVENTVGGKKLPLPGDIDFDGKVTAADARLALRRSVGLEKFASGSPEFLAADVEQDGKISAADARLILRAAVGLEKL